MKLRMRCPNCGNGTMHYGEPAGLREETRQDVFSCRCCGSVEDVEDIEEIAADYAAAVRAVREPVPAAQPRRLEGPILPGQHLTWEPDKPHAREDVVVEEVRTNSDGDVWVRTRGPRGSFWNDEDRVREACVRREDVTTRDDPVPTGEERALWDRLHFDRTPNQLRVLADWHEEHGQDDLAVALRWCARRGKWPACRPETSVWHPSYAWKEAPDRPAGESDEVPFPLAVCMRQDATNGMLTYRTMRQAVNALANALQRLRAITDGEGY